MAAFLYLVVTEWVPAHLSDGVDEAEGEENGFIGFDSWRFETFVALIL